MAHAEISYLCLSALEMHLQALECSFEIVVHRPVFVNHDVGAPDADGRMDGPSMRFVFPLELFG